MPRTLPSFEELRALAEQRPEALEALRRELTDAIIAGAPPARRRRLRGLQFQIEARCRLAPSRMAACVWLSQQLQGKLEELRGALNQGWPVASANPAKPLRRCPVLSLRRPLNAAATPPPVD